MGLASSKAKLKLIDRQIAVERDTTHSVSEPRLGSRLRTSTETDRPDLDGHSINANCEIGDLLREVRERAGEDLRDVSRHLRIRYQYLDAIENGDFKTLPGLTYAIGYVRTYAQHLGLDADRSVALFKSEAQDLEGPRQLVFPSPAPEGKVPGGAIMFVAAILALSAYAGWYYLNASGRAIADYAPAIPESLQSWLGQGDAGASGGDGFTSTAVASIPAPETTPTDSSQTATDKPSEDLKAAPDPVTVEPATDEQATVVATNSVAAITPVASPAAEAPDTRASLAHVPISLAPVAPAQAEPDAAPNPVPKSVPAADAAPVSLASTTNGTAAPPRPSSPVAAAVIPAAPTMNSIGMSQAQAATQTAQAATSRARIIIRASADSWVQVRASDSTTVMTRVMRAGEFYEVPDRQGLHLATGNAGALTILVDGQAIPKLGKLGHIARNIDLDPSQLKQRLN